MTTDKNQIQWQPLIEIIVVMMAILGSTIPLYLNNSAKIDAIHEEIKDFHGRLCAIEERNKK